MPDYSYYTRREYLRRLGVGVGAISMSGWLGNLAARAAQAPHRHQSVIILWLEGGPATIDLWDLKPAHENGGGSAEISTAVAGIKISQHLPKLATWMPEMAILRSISSREGDHGRATQFVKTGYAPEGALQFPVLGSLVGKELTEAEDDLPPFVSVAPGSRTSQLLGSGFLGPRFSPLNIGRQGETVADLRVANVQRHSGVTPGDQEDRLRLLEQMETRFARGRDSEAIDSWQNAVSRAVRLMHPSVAAAFDLEQEKEEVRDRYGPTLFGQGCLLARRLVEREVPCVEVTLGGWDTHSDNFQRVRELAGVLDVGWSALMEDLRSTGLLESTLIVCMGEFGRTPKVNSRGGRDHWPAVWSAVMAGGGVRGGQVIGRTTADGMDIADRPLTVPDLIATVCRCVEIDSRKQNESNVGRPIRIADPGAQIIEELV